MPMGKLSILAESAKRHAEIHCAMHSEGTLSSLAAPPKLIITDSQVFSTVYAQKPAASLL